MRALRSGVKTAADKSGSGNVVKTSYVHHGIRYLRGCNVSNVDIIIDVSSVSASRVVIVL